MKSLQLPRFSGFFCVILLWIYAVGAEAQIAFGPQQIISTSADWAYSVYAADLDGDGDIDVLSASYEDDKIAWYENDGAGNFGQEQIISNTVDGANIVHAADLDGDGDIDVLSTSDIGDRIAWYENNGTGNFGTQQIISTATVNPRFVYTADLDGDGDIDVLSASYGNDKIAWHENDGTGNFGIEQIIYTASWGATSVYAADLDGDGDLDVLSSSYSTVDKIAWYENNGTGNFGIQQIISTAIDAPYSVYAADLDGEGDLDVLSASRFDDKIAWYKNDGFGNFDVQQIISTLANGPSSVYACDLDNDGDMDVMSSSSHDDKIAWYENNGTGSFGPQQVISTDANWAYFVYSADLDGDGDLDVLSASTEDDKIAWYENLLNNASISGTVFYDTNQNGILEGGEFGLDFQNISVEPGSFYSYTNNNGFFTYYPETAGTYILTYSTPDNWSPTTPTSYTLTVVESEISSNHHFGLYPNTLVTNVQPYVTSGINRCNWQVPYYLSIVNEGTIIEQLSVVRLQLDPQLTYINATPVPDSISTQGLLYWHVNNLLPTQQIQFTVLVQEPDFNAMGDTLFNNISVYTYDTNGIETGLSTFGYRPVVNCSYDPNDKTVNPTGIWEQNYTLMGEELFYTIRFQNTGNDTAFNVIVADTLSAWLDHDSFRIINSSHPMQTYRYPNGLVEFHFNNIMLPDSTVNEPGSHGYILYAVSPKDDLLDNTSITNTAHIFFDQNPAIVTNTTQNTMVYELPVIQGLYSAVKTLPHLTLIPNPSSYLLTVQYSSPQSQPITLTLYDLTGRLLFEENLQPTIGTNNYILDILPYPQGLYLVTLNNGVEVVSGKVVKE